MRDAGPSMMTRAAPRATGALLLCVALFAFSGTFGVLAAGAKESGSWSGAGSGVRSRSASRRSPIRPRAG
jgi:hypothetical protein